MKRFQPEGGVKALFFTYFAMIGAISPYLALYFADVGLSIAQIGVLVAVPPAMRIVGPPLWGALADRSGRRVPLLRASAAVAVVIALAIWAVGSWFAALLVLVALLQFATSAQSPLGESMAVSVAAGDAGRYGRMRLWGSIGFTGGVVLMGPLLDAIGLAGLPLLMALLATAVLAVSWRLPEVPAPKPVAGVPVWGRLREPRIAAFFVSCFLMMFAHAALYAFYSLYLDGFGWSKTAIGAAWTIGVLAEIVVFRVQKRLFDRFGALPLLAASFAVAVGRFALIGWGGGALVVVVVGQLLHAVTFGVHHSAVMALLHRWFGVAEQGRAQAMYITLGYGLGGAAGGIVASRLWQDASPSVAFYGAAAAAALGWVAVALCRRFDYARPRDN